MNQICLLFFYYQQQNYGLVGIKGFTNTVTVRY